jgi:hypothetical protein
MEMVDTPTSVSDSRPALGFALLVALICLWSGAKAIRFDTLDPDCFWHLRVADALVARGWPGPIHDELAYGSDHALWTPYSWLGELAMRFVWNLGGYRAAVLTQAIMQATFIAFIALACVEAARTATGKPRYLASVLATAAGAIFSLAYLSFRPVTIALLILAIVAWLLLRDRRLKQRSRAVWLVPILVAIAINVHFFALLVPAWLIALVVDGIDLHL